ncbi:nitrate reductase [Aspergillus eucalypticola CBS 122712]|uniref:Nitrate reductase [NADPH] n=1 Tax=Aspergillus eucalypticola (strain CBS 122712 / IBT 29274) TaxID=1448314 RepID=A0A317VGP6_ASPEC|nr:nitrate reductase [Aspergillus eucalypticola CBS 122712]PWY73543.1 nitrate reductase [Aspergillus eucalypticola CBS 122712]
MPGKMQIYQLAQHPGSSQKEIESEPDWTLHFHENQLGFRNASGRYAGITHIGDELAEDPEEVREAREQIGELKQKVEKGELVNFRDLIEDQKDREQWVKMAQDWPANVRRRQKQEESQRNEQQEKKDEESQEDGGKQANGTKQHKKDQYEDASTQKAKPEQDTQKSEADGGARDDKTQETSPEGLALIRALQHEKETMSSLKQNNGKARSPAPGNPYVTIDEADQFTADNWVPRSPDLVRLTGKLPLNAEPHLSKLFNAGLITPNELHYVRNHGPVPKLVWEFHEIEIEGGRVRISMEELTNNFTAINIPILLACDYTRRRELNMVKRTTGFNWGPGGVSCAYWKGPLLRDVLIAAGVPERMPDQDNQRYWIHFEGADEPSEAKYATSIPFDHVMDPRNDVILAYEMNDRPLPPDHGFPVRVMIPGYVGGRCVKWLSKIWTSKKENDSYYHLHDNRTLPSSVTDAESEVAKLFFSHPDTACYEQTLNSVIARPAQGERIRLSEARKGKTYRIAGFAYSGSGLPVRRVEVSLNGGKTWLYCIREFPERPIRHGDKFWTWVHWHVDVEILQLAQAESITVACVDGAHNTQPEQPRWNISGTLNNCRYSVKPEMVYDNDDDQSGTPYILFRHPVEPGTGDGGWMQPSVDVQVQKAKQSAGAPQKQFTREEIEKHSSEDDCWIVIDGKVYDATRVLSWHPGGKAPILAHAGKVHHETTEEYASIHDDYATQKLQECIQGVVTEKALIYIEKNAERAKKEKQQAAQATDQALQKHRWVPVKLMDRKAISKDTREYTFKLPEGKPTLGIGACQHVEVAFHMKDRMLVRPYTPTQPLLPPEKSSSKDCRGNEKSQFISKVRDGKGTFTLTIKTYFPNDDQPGGAMSNVLDCLPLGEDVDIRGPTGDLVYEGYGNFTIAGENKQFQRVSLVIGGSGITPAYALIARILLTDGDKTEIRVIDANKTTSDILLRDQLDKFVKDSAGQLQVAHVISKPDDDWKGLTGHVNEEIIQKHIFEPSDENVAILCGPPAMIEKAVLPALDDWGYVRDENVFGL